jgi:hypothetical protein
MAQAIRRRPLTVDARVLSCVSPCEICGGPSGKGTGQVFSPVSIISPILRTPNIPDSKLSCPLPGTNTQHINKEIQISLNNKVADSNIITEHYIPQIKTYESHLQAVNFSIRTVP